MRRRAARPRLATRIVLAGAALSGAGAAAAHVVMVPDAAQPGASYEGALRVAHGCSGSATTALRVEFPESVTGVRPQPKAGWTLEIEREPSARPSSVEGGRSVAARVKAVIWRGRLPDDEFDTFGVMLKLPAVPGPLYLPVIQTCEAGTNRWTETPAPGRAWGSVPRPAPVITLGGSPAPRSSPIR